MNTSVNCGKTALYLSSSPIFYLFEIILMSVVSLFTQPTSKEVGLDAVKLLEAGRGENEGCFCFKL